MSLVILVLVLVAQASRADDEKLINEAARIAVERAVESLVQQRESKESLRTLERIGIKHLEGDEWGITDLVKSMSVKLPYNIVLIEDSDWDVIIGEYERQERSDDIILPDTAENLRVQGVQAVLSGQVERADVTPPGEGTVAGPEATVRLQLNIVSLDESNPGSLLWQDQVTGVAQGQVGLDGHLQSLWRNNPITLVAMVLLAGLLSAIILIRRLTTPR